MTAVITAASGNASSAHCVFCAHKAHNLCFKRGVKRQDARK